MSIYLNSIFRGFVFRMHGRLGLIVLFVCMPGVLQAANWRIAPRIGVEEIFTDNIELVSMNEEEEYITRLTPGVAVNAAGRRLALDIDYTLEALAYARESSRNDTYHQLTADAQTELIKEMLFFDLQGSVSQQIKDNNGPISLDNINSVNRANVYAVDLGPSLHNNFNDVAVTDLAYNYGIVNYGSGSSTSDITLDQVDFTIQNGDYFNRFLWQGNFHKSELDRETADDSKREHYDAEMSYRVVRSLAVLARGGHEDDDVPSSDAINNGSYWGAGFLWTPTPRFELGATYGEDNKDANLNWNPLDRTTIQINYRDRDVGLNDEVNWSGRLRHRGRHSVWDFQYTEDITNVQTLQLEGQSRFVVTDTAGNVITDPNTGLPLLLFQNEYLIADEDFLRKRYHFSISLEGIRNNLVLAGYSENRRFEVSRDEEKIVGGNLSWRHRLGARIFSVFGGDWQQREIVASGSEEDIWSVGLSLTRQFQQDLLGGVDYRYIENDSLSTVNDYRENRISVRINKEF